MNCFFPEKTKSTNYGEKKVCMKIAKQQQKPSKKIAYISVFYNIMEIIEVSINLKENTKCKRK